MNPFDTFRDIHRALQPPPFTRLSEWIEKEVRLPEGVSATPGKVRLWPYQVGIADAISDPDIERVTLVKPVRVGFTTLLTSAIGSYVVNEPAPILVLLPTEADCRDYVVSDIEPIFEATPVLKGMRVRSAAHRSASMSLHRQSTARSSRLNRKSACRCSSDSTTDCG